MHPSHLLSGLWFRNGWQSDETGLYASLMSHSAPQAERAKFVTGSTMRHVLVMTATASVGLVAIFIVDMLNLFYISLLGVQELAAAVGFASTLMFFMLSISIGLTIPCAALVGRCLGRGEREEAAEMGGVSMVFMGLVTALSTLAVWPFLDQLLWVLGARGETLDLAARFLNIVIPSTPIMALGMCTTGILRGLGDARRAMFVTLSSGLAAAIFDPILIFGLDLGLDGAAISTVLSRLVMLAVGLYGAQSVHKLVSLPNRARLSSAAKPFFAIGVPAILTQIATPIGNAFVTGSLARFGDDAVAGMAVIGRLVPVAFVAMFALSGAIGPILAQNLGAGEFDRLRQTLRDSMLFNAVYALSIWLVLALFAHHIADIFGAHQLARELVVFFCTFVAGSYLFNGMVFVASATFNNVGHPAYSTMLNWARSTLGVIPFVWIGAQFYGAKGALAGSGIGVVVFGLLAYVLCHRVVNRIIERDAGQKVESQPDLPPSAQSPFSTGKAATLQ